MKKDYSVTSLAGALLWATAVILRRLSLPASEIVSPVLNMLPKFGIVWIVVGLTVTFWPHLAKKPFPPNRVYLLILLSLLPVALYKIAFPLVFGGGIALHPLDFVASLSAAGWLALAHFMEQRQVPSNKTNKAAEEKEIEALTLEE